MLDTEFAAIASADKCPRIAVCIGTEIAQIIPEHMIGNATLKNAPHIFLFSGRNIVLNKLMSNNLTFVSIFHIYTTMIRSSSILAVSVPTAAPWIPISGNPKCPKISVELIQPLVINDTTDITNEIFTVSTLLSMAISRLLIMNSKNVHFRSPRYAFPSAIISGDVVNILKSCSGIRVHAVTTIAPIRTLSTSATPVILRIAPVSCFPQY